MAEKADETGMGVTHQTVENAAREVVEVSAGLKVLGASHHSHDDAGSAELVATLSMLGGRGGTLVVYSTWAGATEIATGMLGASDRSYDDGTVRDAMGELLNQIAGTIKRSVAASGSDLLLSPPVVVSGTPLSHGVRTHDTPIRVDLEIGDASIRICLWQT